MARRSSTASAADAVETQSETGQTEENQTETTTEPLAPAAETASDGERTVSDAGTQEQHQDSDTQVPETTQTDTSQPQAPEHPESGEGEQAGSVTGEETEHGAEKGESDKGAVSAEGEGATTTHLESVQRSGDLSDASGEIPPGSTGTRNPDPELANNLGQNEKAAAREAHQLEDVKAGTDRRTARKAMNDKNALESLNEELRDAEDDVARAVARRDELRTEHDRLTERMASANATPFGDITSSYFASSDAQAKKDAEAREKLGALGLSGLLSKTA